MIGLPSPSIALCLRHGSSQLSTTTSNRKLLQSNRFPLPISIDAAKAKFENMTEMISELASERHKVKQSLKELKCRMDSYEPKLRDMPSEALEEEIRALMSDKSGETEYQESMQSQIDSIKEISHMVRCGCGEEYRVEVDLCV